MTDLPAFHEDPMRLAKIFWPHVRFYDKQVQIIESVAANPETFVPAGNMLGKDFVAGYISLAYFIGTPECRVVTTSVKDDHLRVLWGEIGRFVSSSKFDLRAGRGGVLRLNHRDVGKLNTWDYPQKAGVFDTISYLRGMVSQRGEGMAGHHARYTLGIVDEASGVDDEVFTQMGTWAKRVLAIGNPNPPRPGAGYFKACVEQGDLYRE